MMPDDKTSMIMGWLEGLAQPDWRPYHSDSEVQFTANASLELLEEQEKTIKDLTDIIQQLNQHIKDLSEYMTPYGKIKDIKAAAELLNEQEAVEPIKMQRMDGNFSFFVPYYLCGNCRYELVGKDVMFCHHCWRSVKWE